MKATARLVAGTILTLGPWLMPTVSFADEPYEFYKIDCNDIIPSFEVEAVVYSNIRHVVWPAATEENSWPAHVRSLKSLESRDQLYVFDQWYGHHDGSDHLAFTCGDLSAKIEYGASYREEGPVGSGEPVRMGGVLSVESKRGLLVENIRLTSFRKLRVYGPEEHIELCGADTCEQKPASAIEVVRTNKLQRKIGE